MPASNLNECAKRKDPLVCAWIIKCLISLFSPSPYVLIAAFWPRRLKFGPAWACREAMDALYCGYFPSDCHILEPFILEIAGLDVFVDKKYS